MPAAQWDNGDLILALKITARASRDNYQGIYAERHKIALTAPPEDGKANKYLLAYLAKQFGSPQKDITLLSGQFAPLKVIRIHHPQILPKDWILPKKP